MTFPVLISVLAISASAVWGVGRYRPGATTATEARQPPPVGHYGCYSAPVTTPRGPGYGSSIYRNRQREGDVWINSDHEYAGPNDKADVGTYVMDGSTLVAKSGAFAPPGPKTHIRFTPARGKDPASLYIVYFDENDKPSRGTECVWSDPLQ